MEKTWCEHTDRESLEEWIKYKHHWLFCPVCGTPRPKESKLELPEKCNTNTQSTVLWYPVEVKINEILDYLASKPWESK